MLDRICLTVFMKYIWTKLSNMCKIVFTKMAALETVAEPTLTEARP